MPITIVAEDGSGNPDANSYNTLAAVNTYHENRGNTYWANVPEESQKACLIRATDYIDKRFGDKFRGFRMQKDQALAWPRLAAFDEDEYLLNDVPANLQKAHAEYALRAAIYNVLAPDPIRTTPAQDMGVSSQAEGILTLTGNASDSEIVTIGTTVYTFKTALTPTAFEVFIGALPTDTLDNLIAAITAGAGAGVAYAAGTTAHPDVDAVAGAGDTMEVTAHEAGVAGNGIVTSDTMAAGSWSHFHLEGGTAVSSSVQQDTTNLVVGPIKSKTDKVGPISTSRTYEGVTQLTQANANSSRNTQSTIINDIFVPQYPEADLLIARLIDNTTSIHMERA